jgi:rhodanese-related sulfurtransferase
MNINVHDADFSAQLAKLDKDKPVLVYCAAGSRSARAVSIMKEMGFSEIHELKGGYNAW